MITSDAHSGLKAAIRAVFPSVPWQRCQFHLQQNAQAYVPKVSLKKEVASDIRHIFNAPIDIINAGWRNIVINPNTKEIYKHGYTLCFIDHLQANMRSRDIHLINSERWCDPRAKLLLKGETWNQYKTPVCLSLNLLTNFDEAFDCLSTKLDDAYHDVLKRIPQNDAIEIVKNKKGKDGLKLSKLDKIEKIYTFFDRKPMIFTRLI
jgi:hypothetical protein